MTGLNYEMMPLIDNSRPPGAAQLVGWQARCLHCPATSEQLRTVEQINEWMSRHDTAHGRERPRPPG